MTARMLPPLPKLADYEISERYGFLPDDLPLQVLPDPYYTHWEAIISNLQAFILSGRLRTTVQKLPILSTSRLKSLPEWRRAYLILAFITHGYIWGGDIPADRIPPPIAVPFLQVCKYLELPPVATYAGVCLWNFKPIFSNEDVDDFDNLATLSTFTGSMDESWFYLVSIALEARGAGLIPVMLEAMQAVRDNDAATVTNALQVFAERLDELGTILNRMYEHCDPHIFYHRIRPFLAGSKNMAEAGLPNGILFEDNSGNEEYRQHGGGSNAQSSLIQFFDIVLGVEHYPTGQGAPADFDPALRGPSNNFIHEMRSYMPGPHARFLQALTPVANIRPFVLGNQSDRDLVLAYDAALSMLRALRDKHITMVSRYIIVKSREARHATRPASDSDRSVSPPKTEQERTIVNLATASGRHDTQRKRSFRGTGGTSLIPFLKQARDETGSLTVDSWARRLLSDRPIHRTRFAGFAAPPVSVQTEIIDAQSTKPFDIASKSSITTVVDLDKVNEHKNGTMEVVGLAGTWSVDDTEGGGICHW